MNPPDVIVAWLQSDYGTLGRPAEAIAHALKDLGLARNVAYVEPFEPEGPIDLKRKVVRGVEVYSGTGTPPAGAHAVADAVISNSGLERPILINCGAVAANWWIYSEFAPVISAEVLVVHDRFDQVADFADQAPRLRAVRRLLVESADAVCGLSQGSITDLPGAVYVGHGIDEHWTKPDAGDVPEPAELADIPHPRAVYVGAMSVRFDIDAVIALAQSGVHVVLVGFGEPPALLEAAEREPNLHLIGPRMAHDTPGFLVHADVGIIPHLDEPFTHSMEPHKAYNYAAAGLRTVTLNTTTAPALRTLMTATSTIAEFVDATRAAIDAGRLGDDDLALARSLTWGSVAARVLATVIDKQRDAA